MLAVPVAKIRKQKILHSPTAILPELEPEPSVGQGTGPRRPPENFAAAVDTMATSANAKP